jgi:hypothetical protein
MAKGKRYVSRTDDKQLRENPGGHHLQIAVAVITGVFAVSAAVLSAILGSGNNGGSSSPGQHPVASSPVLPSLSAPAMSLIDLRMKSCLGATSPVPDIGEVAITSPPSGAATDIHGTIHGTAKLSGSVQLYFFAYSDGPCAYYFMPSPIGVKADDSWQVQLYLEGNVPGDKVFLYAAVVGPDANATLREILHYFDVKDESAYVYELPSGTRAAHIDVVISS